MIEEIAPCDTGPFKSSAGGVLDILERGSFFGRKLTAVLWGRIEEGEGSAEVLVYVSGSSSGRSAHSMERERGRRRKRGEKR